MNEEEYIQEVLRFIEKNGGMLNDRIAEEILNKFPGIPIRGRITEQYIIGPMDLDAYYHSEPF